jgi:adenylosuccinate synthase
VDGAIADQLRALGNEYGAVTGRPRRCGWVDLVLLRYAQMINGVNWWVVTKLDVLDQLDEIPVCMAYKVNGKKTDSVPALATGFETVKCVYEKLPGWKTSTEGITRFDKLPKKAQHYLRFLEKETGARIGMVSTGPERDQTIFMPDFEAELVSVPQKIARAK